MHCVYFAQRSIANITKQCLTGAGYFGHGGNNKNTGAKSSHLLFNRILRPGPQGKMCAWVNCGLNRSMFS